MRQALKSPRFTTRWRELWSVGGDNSPVALAKTVGLTVKFGRYVSSHSIRVASGQEGSPISTNVVYCDKLDIFTVAGV